MTGPDHLSIVLFSGGYDRVHYALVLASAAAATSRKATLFWTGRAVLALLDADAAGRPGWHRLDQADDGTAPADRDSALAERGVATFEELLSACAALDVRFVACEMGLRALGLDDLRLRPDLEVERAGAVTFLNDASPGGAMLFV